jgi:class 3 adenylate cyclase
MNAPAERLLATTIDDAAGKPYQTIFGPSLSDRILGLFLRAARSGDSAMPHQVRATVPGGRRLELRASMGPIRDAEGAIVGLLFVADTELRDIELVSEQAHMAERLRLALRRYLGENIADMIEQRPSFVGVGGLRKHVSVLHADIRGYTTVAEAMEPEELATLLLKYHGGAVDALRGEGATLDRFIGDSVLAIWNAPGACDDHSRAAIRGALAVQAAAHRTGSELSYGIGLHTGDAVVGNVGNESYLNYTAVGDTVNVAARLQALAAPGEVLCSEKVLEEAGDGIRTFSLGDVNVKGRIGAIAAYRIEGMSGAGAVA